MEVLVLPTSYILRTMKQLAPKSSADDDENAATVAVMSSRNYTAPFTALKERDILLSHYPLVMVYSLPGYGSTSLAVSLITQIEQEFPDRWVCYINLRKASKLMTSELRGAGPREPWTLAELVCTYHNITANDAISKVENFLPTRASKETCKNSTKRAKLDKVPILSEIFLDELDEMNLANLEITLKMLQRVDWKKCQARVWLLLRHHVKPKLDAIFPSTGSDTFPDMVIYELLPLSREQQIMLLFNYWKAGMSKPSQGGDQALKKFVTQFHHELERIMPGFSKTIGVCPFHLLLVPKLYPSSVESFERVYNEDPTFSLNVSTITLFEEFIKGKIEAYLEKIGSERPTPGPVVNDGWKQLEYRRIQRHHIKLAILMYHNNFTGSHLIVEQNMASELEHEMFRVGILCKVNGHVSFFHEMYAEFMVAQFFVDSGRQKNTGMAYLNFFFNNVLFDEKSKNIRQIFDAYLTVQHERRKLKTLAWAKMGHFLIAHYRLSDEKASPGNEINADITTANSVDRLEYEDIQNNGTILHLALIEGHFKIFQLLVESLKQHPVELGKLLKCCVNLELFPRSIFLPCSCLPEKLSVPTLHAVALFAHGTDFLEKIFPKICLALGQNFVKEYFQEGRWTPLHFAAMTSNWQFMKIVLSPNKKLGIRHTNIKNSSGQMPLHLALNRTWYFTLRIVDHPHPPLGAWGPSSSSSSILVKAVAAVPKASTGGTDASNGKSSSRPKSPEFVLKPTGIMGFEGIEREFDERWGQKNNTLTGHLKALEQLLGNKGNPNVPLTANGMTPLHLASTLGSGPVITFLLGKGADPELKDASGNTAIRIAAKFGNVDGLEEFRKHSKRDDCASIADLLGNGPSSSNFCSIC